MLSLKKFWPDGLISLRPQSEVIGYNMGVGEPGRKQLIAPRNMSFCGYLFINEN